MVLVGQSNSKLFEGPGGCSGHGCDGDAVQVQQAVAVLELVGEVGAGDAQHLSQECAGDRPASAQECRQETVVVVEAAGLRVEVAAGAVEAALEGRDTPGSPAKTFRQSVTQIMLADVSMSLDNVLAVAGAARDHAWVLIGGLAVSVALMGAASTVIARLLHRFHWIASVGLAIVLWVAVQMVFDGLSEVAETVKS